MFGAEGIQRNSKGIGEVISEKFLKGYPKHYCKNGHAFKQGVKYKILKTVYRRVEGKNISLAKIKCPKCGVISHGRVK